MSPMYSRYWRNMLILGSIILVGWGLYELRKWAWGVVGW